jgi:hypothetical protein
MPGLAHWVVLRASCGGKVRNCVSISDTQAHALPWGNQLTVTVVSEISTTTAG